MIGQTDLRGQLGIDWPKLKAWLAEGLPHHRQNRRRMFDPAEVAAWLIDNGKATADLDPDPAAVLNTRAEVAQHFGVSTRTVSEWQDLPGFPGRPGTAGKRDGFYPVDAIADWMATRDRENGGDGTDELGQAIRRERLRKLRLANDTAEGQLVDLELVRRFVVHAHSLARRELANLPAEILQALPSDTGETVKAETRRKVQARVDAAADILAQLIAAYDDSPDESAPTG